MTPASLLCRFLSITALMALLATGCAQQSDHEARYKPLVDRYMKAWNDGNVDALDDIIHQDFKRHSDVATTLRGVTDLKQLITGFRTANPDVRLVSNDELYAENRFAGRWALVGATGTESPGAQLWGINIIRFQDGKIIEEWDAFDNLSYKATRGYQITPP